MSQRVDRVMNRIRMLDSRERVELAKRFSELITLDERMKAVRLINLETLQVALEVNSKALEERSKEASSS